MTRSPNSLAESVTCLALALREATRPGLALLSSMLALAAFVFWAIVFMLWWSGIVSLAVWAVGRSAALFQSGVAATQAPLSTVIVAHVLVVVVFVLLVMITLRILIEFVLMARIQAHCLKRYPQLTTGVKSSVLGGLRDLIGPLTTFILGGLACLLIPIVGGVLFFVLASYLNVRGLANDALDGLATDDQRRAVVKASRVELVVIGVATSMLMLIPFAGFFAPVVMGAGVCHLFMRALARQAEGREAAATPPALADAGP